MFAWFRARCNDQQLPPRCKTISALRPGIAPDLRASKAHVASTRRREFRNHQSSGGWTRTITRLLNREPPYRLGHTGLLFTKVRTTGFEPAISCTRSTRNTKLSHILITRVAQWESNPHFRHGKAVGCRYIMGAFASQPNCQTSISAEAAAKSTEPESNPHCLVTTEASCR